MKRRPTPPLAAAARGRAALFSAAILLLAATVAPAADEKPAVEENWPCWRGPRGDGTSLEPNVPVRWDGRTGENIVWRVPVEGVAHSSPIVWEDRLFVTTCVEATGERLLLCYDRGSGRQLWRQVVLRAPLEKLHKLNTRASGTPATDGELVYVTFLEPDFGYEQTSGDWRDATPGNMVVAAYDFQGRRRWLVRPGRFSSVHGYCSSPVLYRDTVIVNGDHDGDSYLVALRKADGQTVWKVDRDHKTRSYCTPIIREIGGRTQMILSGSRHVASYDPASGVRHWYIDGPTEQFVASPVFNGNVVIITAGFPEYHIVAIRPDGRGNVTDTHIEWRTTRGCAYVPSPIVVGKYFLIASDSGIGSCFEADTGERYWMQRMGPHYSASLVSAMGLAYFLADDGVMKVVRPGPEYDEVAVNELGEHCFASPAISRGQIFLRSEEHLWCIGRREP